MAKPPRAGGPSAADSATSERAPAERGTQVDGSPELRIHLERVVPGGDSIGRQADGQWVFVSGAVPGDIVAVSQLARRRGALRALDWRLVEPAPGRRVPPCPIAERCGGCDWMVLDDACAAEHKLELLRDALTRVGGFRQLPNEPQLVTASGLGYRSRVRLQISREGELGFLARGSHEHVAVAHCVVCTPELNQALARLREHFASDLDAAAACAAFGQLELRSLAVRCEVRLLAREGRRGPVKGTRPLRAWLSRLQTHFDVSSDVRDLIATPPTLAVPLFFAELGAELVAQLDAARAARLGSVSLLVAPGAFTQVNWAINRAVVGELLLGALERGSQRFLDLYSGIGNFSLPLLALGLKGLGIEQNPQAVACAREATQAQQLGGEFLVGAVEDRARVLRQRGERFDLVVLDPARAGAGPALPEIAALAVKDIFYCACDPVSLARDLRWLVEHGFALRQITAYDMFPQTHHVETTAWLTRVSN